MGGRSPCQAGRVARSSCVRLSAQPRRDCRTSSPVRVDRVVLLEAHNKPMERRNPEDTPEPQKLHPASGPYCKAGTGRDSRRPCRTVRVQRRRCWKQELPRGEQRPRVYIPPSGCSQPRGGGGQEGATCTLTPASPVPPRPGTDFQVFNFDHRIFISVFHTNLSRLFILQQLTVEHSEQTALFVSTSPAS